MLAALAALAVVRPAHSTLRQKQPVLIDLPFSAADVSLEAQRAVVASEHDYFAWRAESRLRPRKPPWLGYYPWLIFYPSDPAGRVVCPPSQSRRGVVEVVDGGGGPHDLSGGGGGGGGGDGDGLFFAAVSAEFGVPLAPLDAEAFNPDNRASERVEVRRAGLGTR